MTAKEYLNTYREYSALEREKYVAYQLAAEKIDSIPTALNVQDGIKTNSRKDYSRTEALAIELSERRNEWAIAALNAVEVRQNIFDVIDSIADGKIVDILYYRYLSLLTWEKVCDAVGLSWYAVHKKHREGLELIEKAIN